jgi:hypothetical protein
MLGTAIAGDVRNSQGRAGLIIINSQIATLRSAISWKNLIKKNLTKKISKKNFREIFFQFFFGYRCSTANLGYACKYLGALGPLV